MTPPETSANNSHGGEEELSTELHIAVVYDSAENAGRALNICSRLVQEFDEEFPLAIALCHFRHLESLECTVPAVGPSSRPNVLLFAISEPLSEPVCAWLDGWGRQAEVRPSAVGVLPARNPNNISYLIEFCARTGIELIRAEERSSSAEMAGKEQA